MAETDKQKQSHKSWLACPDCDTLHRMAPVPPPHDGKCCSCGRTLFSRTVNSINRTLAFSIAGLVLMIPANVYPIVTFSSYGVKNKNILYSGPDYLFIEGLPAVATLVFLTSILFPILFLLGLAYVSLWSKLRHFPKDYALTLRATQGLYRWGMIDVYLLGCLVAFIKLSQLATVVPGTGLYCLAGVLVCTLLAALSFDPDLLWRRYGACTNSIGFQFNTTTKESNA
ncbi:paraquat-inducible protein A [Rubellicoccus peritrichatus]|uniref:Paraquat-inducible protein A n=1 Tax=Rubellicoccus peritrichatus TaxID=3080537 RepID=A0AAQ3LEI3_9BACT|nr:paraquat-inducible protein A [Puniceicoccus sp. CR14]WOO42163.1 paraquat-inducible protein A [Puniceicoccus sp. CR14]